MKRTLYKLSLGALLLSTATLYATPSAPEIQTQLGQQQKMQGKKHHKKHHGLNKMLKRLQLTQEQQQRIKGYKKNMRQQMKSIHKSSTKVIAFHPTYFDKSLFISQARTMFEKKIQIRADFMENIYNTLTPTQKAQMIQVMQSRQNKK